MKKYDLVFSMGSTCACSQALRYANLQLASFPFDWNGGPSIIAKSRLMAEDFHGFFDRTKMIRMKEKPSSNTQWWCDEAGFRYIHDFSASCNFDEEYYNVQIRYRRRIDRLCGLVGSSKFVLVVYLVCPGWADAKLEDVEQSREILACRWPGTKFDFLILHNEEGCTVEQMHDYEVNGCRMVSFDYKKANEDDWLANFDLIGKWLKTQYQVVDYRTPEEKIEWEKKVAAHKWGRYKAKTFCQYLINKYSYKLYVHLRKHLEKKGVV